MADYQRERRSCPSQCGSKLRALANTGAQAGNLCVQHQLRVRLRRQAGAAASKRASAQKAYLRSSGNTDAAASCTDDIDRDETLTGYDETRDWHEDSVRVVVMQVSCGSAKQQRMSLHNGARRTRPFSLQATLSPGHA